MDDLNSRKEEANRLRKEGKFEEALAIYRDLWKDNGDKFDGCGLLNCLRNLQIWSKRSH